MADILDYLTWRGDLTSEERALNEIDYLILSELSYAEMDGIVPGTDSDETVSIADLCRIYLEKGTEQKGLVNQPKGVISVLGTAARFKDMRAGWYVSWTNQEQQTQFSAITFFTGDGSVFVSFRGTDNTITGWREDFNMSYLAETPGQLAAAKYLSFVCQKTDLPIVTGGHSKGGNLAVYAGAFCEERSRDKVRQIYSFDGPGFNRNIVSMPEYAAVVPKVQLIIPEQSIIGILLSNKHKRKVIRSSAKGSMQHNPYTWLVAVDSFEEADAQSPMSVFLDETLNEWVEQLDEEQRAAFVDAVFDALEASGAETFREMNDQGWESVNAVLKAARAMEPERQKNVVDVIRRLAAVGTEAIFDEAKKSLVRVLERGIPGAPRNQAGNKDVKTEKITDQSTEHGADRAAEAEARAESAGQTVEPDQSAEGTSRSTGQAVSQSTEGVLSTDQSEG